MDVKQLIFDRNVGLLHLLIVTNDGAGLKYILERVGLFPIDASQLIQIANPDIAINILEFVFSHDLAYRNEVMPKEKASKYAKQFVNEFYSDNSKIYTNGNWDQYGIKSLNYECLTPMLIDGGIIIVHNDYIAIIWVMDTD